MAAMIVVLAVTIGACNKSDAAEPLAKPRLQAVVCVQDGCPPCRKMEIEVLAKLPPSGWRVATDDNGVDPATAHVWFSKNFPPDSRVRSTPTVIFVRDGREVGRKGFLTAEQLVAEYARLAKPVPTRAMKQGVTPPAGYYRRKLLR